MFLHFNEVKYMPADSMKADDR